MLMQVKYKGWVTHAVLMKPGAVTHQNDMGQRGIKLLISWKTWDGYMGVKFPPHARIAPPGWYMLFLMNTNAVPCKEALWVRLG
jgi:Domain of unknown function (DUF1929)